MELCGSMVALADSCFGSLSLFHTMDGYGISLETVLPYVTSVKKAFLGEPAKYQEFLEILKDFTARGMHGSNINVRMAELLKDHLELLLGLIDLLPHDNIDIPESTAFTYLLSVRKAFRAQPAKYEEFRNLLTYYSAHRTGDATVILRAEELFKDHRKLLFAFLNILPAEAKVNIPPEATESCAFMYILTVKNAFGAQHAKFREFVKLITDVTEHRLDVETFIGNMEELMKDLQHLLLGLNFFLPKAHRTVSPEAEQRAAKFLGKLKRVFQGDDLHVFESFREILENFKEGKKSVKEVQVEVVQLLQDYDELVLDLFYFFSARPLESAKYIQRLLQL